MSFQKQKLRGELTERGWELLAVDPEGIDWWAYEHWRLRSIRENWGLEIVVTFQHVGDPRETDPRDPPTKIVATTSMPPLEDRAASTIAVCSYRRHFDEELPRFLDALDGYRRSPAVEKRERSGLTRR